MRVYYLNLKKLKKNAILAALFLLVALLLTVVLLSQSLEPVAGKHAGIIYRVKTDKKVCALTFDIGWGEKVPGPVLDILKQYDVKSTFFLAGPGPKGIPKLRAVLPGKVTRSAVTVTAISTTQNTRTT